MYWLTSVIWNSTRRHFQQRAAHPFCLFSNQKRSPFLIRSNWSKTMAEKTGPGPPRDSRSPPGKSSSLEMSPSYSSAILWSSCWSGVNFSFSSRSWYDRPLWGVPGFLPAGRICWAVDLCLRMCLQEADPELFGAQCNSGGQSLFLSGRSAPPGLSGRTSEARTWSLSGCKRLLWWILIPLIDNQSQTGTD